MTTQFKGTPPGPWTFNKNWGHIYDSNDDEICSIIGANRNDAILMVAAPDLLEALEQLLEETQQLYGRPARVIKAEIKARAAIAKALGNERGLSTLGAVGIVAVLWVVVMLGAFVYYF